VPFEPSASTATDPAPAAFPVAAPTPRVAFGLSAFSTVPSLPQPAAMPALPPPIAALSLPAFGTAPPGNATAASVAQFATHALAVPAAVVTAPATASVFGAEIPCGLRNIGNTCYINSILQALNTIPMLVEHFLLGRHMDDFIPDGRTISMSEEFANVLRHLRFPNAASCFVPTSFIDCFRKLCPQLLHNAINSQHDCVEFTSSLLSLLHNELKFGSSTYRLGGDRSIHADHSIISDLFDGETRCTITCQRCQNKSVTRDTIKMLILEIPLGDGPFTLETCLELYCKPEALEDVMCSYCNSRGNSIKCIEVTRLAPVIIMQLKRFSADGSKINSNIMFPTENLDLSVVLVPGSERPAIRSLIAVCYHLTLSSVRRGKNVNAGHYTACCKNNEGGWADVNDSKATKIPVRNVNNHNAYVLVYIDPAFRYILARHPTPLVHFLIPILTPQHSTIVHETDVERIRSELIPQKVTSGWHLSPLQLCSSLFAVFKADIFLYSKRILLNMLAL
jgi:ubiquitin C-terminal hydrolase